MKRTNKRQIASDAINDAKSDLSLLRKNYSPS